MASNSGLILHHHRTVSFDQEIEAAIILSPSLNAASPSYLFDLVDAQHLTSHDHHHTYDHSIEQLHFHVDPANMTTSPSYTTTTTNPISFEPDFILKRRQEALTTNYNYTDPFQPHAEMDVEGERESTLREPRLIVAPVLRRGTRRRRIRTGGSGSGSSGTGDESILPSSSVGIVTSGVPAQFSRKLEPYATFSPTLRSTALTPPITTRSTLQILSWSPQSGMTGTTVMIYVDPTRMYERQTKDGSFPPTPSSFITLFGAIAAEGTECRFVPRSVARSSLGGQMMMMGEGVEGKDLIICLTSFVPERERMGATNETIVVMVQALDERMQVIDQVVVGTWGSTASISSPVSPIGTTIGGSVLMNGMRFPSVGLPDSDGIGRHKRNADHMSGGLDEQQGRRNSVRPILMTHNSAPLSSPTSRRRRLSLQSSPPTPFSPSAPGLTIAIPSWAPPLGGGSRLLQWPDGNYQSISPGTDSNSNHSIITTPIKSASTSASTTSGSPLRHPPPLLRSLSQEANPPPELIRTSQIRTESSNKNHVKPFVEEAALRLKGDLQNMVVGWSDMEVNTRRRLVVFTRRQEGHLIHTAFEPVAQSEYVNDSIVISCIYRDDKNECFVTSVDTIYLLEALIGVRFTVEEKNRIRRNLEGFKPITCSKNKDGSEEFCKQIVAYGPPRPRNIDKDLKVFPWKILATALTKIISKYSAVYSPGVVPPIIVDSVDEPDIPASPPPEDINQRQHLLSPPQHPFSPKVFRPSTSEYRHRIPGGRSSSFDFSQILAESSFARHNDASLPPISTTPSPHAFQYVNHHDQFQHESPREGQQQRYQPSLPQHDYRPTLPALYSHTSNDSWQPVFNSSPELLHSQQHPSDNYGITPTDVSPPIASASLTVTPFHYPSTGDGRVRSITDDRAYRRSYQYPVQSNRDYDPSHHYQDQHYQDEHDISSQMGHEGGGGGGGRDRREMTSVIGLDIGQLGSKIGAARNRGIDVLVNEVSNRATPSLVAFGPRSRMIGETAKTQETSNFRNTIGSLKRLIGRTIDDEDIEIEKKFLSSELVKVGTTVGVKVQYLGEEATFSATQLYAMFLGRLRDTAAKELKTAVNDVVIAVPVWYTDIQRRAVIDAAEIAGLNPLRLINDTTATALGYGITKTDLPAVEEPPRYIAFVDIGHSDYSVSIVAFNKGSLIVKSTAFDRHFGGRDLDYALVQHFATEFKSKYKIDVLSNKKALFRLSAAVEKLKKILSANAAAPLSVESIMEDIDASSTLTRDEFEGLIAPLLERTISPLERALAEAGIDKDQIEAVELVGGSTRVPALKNRIEEFFGRPLSFTTNQDEAIARGATLACAMLSPVFKVREFTTTDTQLFPITLVWETTEDLEAGEGNELLVFERGNAIPSTKILSFTRAKAFELEAQYAESSALPGSINPWISKCTVKKATSAEPQTIKVKARLNNSGILSFESATQFEDAPEEVVEEAAAGDEIVVDGEEAKVPAKKVKKTIKTVLSTITGSTSLDASLVNEFREKEGQMAAADKLVLETEDRKNALEEYVYDVREKLDGQWAKYVNESDKDALRSKLSEAEDWLYTEEGEDATKSAYVARLDILRSGGDPINLRFREHDERPRATAALRDVLSTFMDKAQSGDEKFSHLAEKDLNTVIETVANAESWLGNLIARQAERSNDLKPVVTSDEITKKKEDIFAICNPIMTRPAPKVKVDTSKPATPTPEAQAATEEVPELVVEGDAMDTDEKATEDAPKVMEVDDID